MSNAAVMGVTSQEVGDQLGNTKCMDYPEQVGGDLGVLVGQVHIKGCSGCKSVYPHLFHLSWVLWDAGLWLGVQTYSKIYIPSKSRPVEFHHGKSCCHIEFNHGN